MGLLKKRIKNKFTPTPNEIINSKNLSFRAKGIWTFLNSKPDDWKFSVYRISQESKDGRDAVRNAIKELEKESFLFRKAIKDENGKFNGYDYIISDVPMIDEADDGINDVEVTDDGKTVNGKVVLHNNTISSNTISENKDITNTEKDKSANLFGEQIDTPFVPVDILDYLNNSLKKKNPKKRGFGNVDSNLTQIKARLREKKANYKLSDFKAVIDYKIGEWFGKEKTEKWLRPKTLFGDKFDMYLTQALESDIQNKDWGNNNFVESTTTEDDLL